MPNDKMFVWPSTTRNKAKYTGYGPPNYSRDRLNSNGFAESYSTTPSSVSLNTDYRQHLGFTSSRYRSGGNDCCSNDQCDHDDDESPGGGRDPGRNDKDKLPPLPTIDGYGPLVPIVPQFFHSNSFYRSVKLSTGQPVLVTVSAEGTLEDLIRVSYEWQLLRGDVEDAKEPATDGGEATRSDSFRDNLTNKDWAGQEYSLPRDLAGILRPSELVQVSSEPPISALIFDNNEKLMTLREKFLDLDLVEEGEVSPIRPLNAELDTSVLNPKAKVASNGRPQKSPVKLTISPATANGVAGCAGAPTPFSPTPFHRTKDEILEILRAIVSVLTTIAEAHQHNITHHGLNPGRIFLNEKGETFISSWDFSFCLRVEDPAKGYRRTHIKQMGNNMYYVSPETTGEMNRLVDFRADFYSIGCILYELLIGSPPFKSADPLELGYMHVSCAPVAPQLLASWVPEQLGAVVMKLLEKNSDSRYQTAESIISDLEYIYDCLEKDVKLDNAFEPASGSTNVLSRFLVPQLIYGRDSEITTMSTVYEKLLEKGCAQMIVVRGDPGIGKSRLVYELEKSVIARHGYFAMAKFDQYQRVPPFYTTITILNDLIHQLLSASQTTILNWRERILTNIKVDMSVLFGPIPELRQLVGPDYHDIVPEGPPLGPVKRELRIKYLVKSLFCLFGVFGLAIFLDDIQWCFPTDFEFFVELQSFAKENHFDDVRVTLVCSAICNDDPLASKCNFLLDIIKQTDAPFVEIALQPLAKEAVRQIIAQTLSIRPAIAGSSERRTSVSRKSSFTYDTDVSTTTSSAVAAAAADPQVESLTDIVYRITEGNPLFISCLLRYLYYRGYIYLDQNTRGGNSNIGKWKVDFDMLLSHTLPRSVQETTISMYESLPPLTYKIIRYAACICSNTFTLEDLALSLEISFSEAAEALYPALEVELILPTTLHYKFPFSKADRELNLSNDQIRQIARQAKYRFYHDLVQQSVYFHIDDNEKAEIHRQIGLRLLGKHDAKKMPAHKVLEIATQLRKALTIVRDDEKIIYRDLNIQAGHLVFDMTDFDMAFRFFDVAKKLLPPDPWKHHEAITRDIYLSLMELQFLRKKHQSCLELIDQVFPHCTDIMDQAQCLKTKVKALSAVKKKDEAIAASLEVLALLGFHLQEDEEWNEKNYSVLRHRIPLSVGEIRDLAHNPVTKDVRMLLAHEVIFITLIPVLLSNRKHFIRSLTLVAVTAFLDYGSSSVCAFSLLTLASHFQKDGGSINLTRAYEYSKLAIVTLECDSTVNLDFGMNTYEYYVLTLAIYFEPLSEVIRYYDIVMKTGQTIYDPHGTVAFSLGLRPMCKFLAGESLQSIHTMFVNLEASTTQLDHRISRLWLKIHTQAILNLMGDGHNDPSCLEGELLGNKEDVEEIMSSKAEEVQYAYNVCRLLLAVVYKHKYVASDIILHDLKYTMTTLPVTVYHVIVTFYGALAIIDSEGRYSEESEPLLEQFARDLEDWSATCPSTFLHKHLCIKAELHKHTCDSIITLDTYEEAIQAALKEGFLQDAAVINERCGDWLQTHSKNRSVAYYQEAAKFYGAWGARLKVNQLVHKYPEIQSSNYELNHLTLLTNTSASSNAYYSDLRARSSLISNSVLVQSPLRWILSSLLREEENKEQIPTKDMTPNALQALAVNDESEVITSPLIMQGIGAGKVMNQQGEESSAGRIVLDHNTKHTQMLKGKKTDEQDVKSALQACLDISEAIDTTSIVRKLIESVLVIGGADYAVFISLDDDGGLYVDSVGVLNTITQIRHEPLISRSDLAPMSVIQHVLITGTPISRQADTRKFDTVHGRDHFFYNRSYQSVLCMPIQNQIKSVGILYLEHQHNFRVFSLQRIELISLLCTQAAVSMEKARLYHQMDLAKKAAEEATAEKASFLANMSHEIRTPFNALLSCSIFLMDTNLTVVQREYVDTIRSSAMLTLNIIDAILAFSKIEHGSIDLENSPFSLRECIESAIQLVAEPAATKDLELVHLNRCGEVDIVNGDVTRFRQIVINLVGNAVKFTSKGYIVVESHAERVSSDHRYEFVISVTDTGIGIPKNARDKVFRAFSQVDGSARRVFGGSGLGLAISKKLAELMGGGLTFDSVEGEGTTFWFSLVARAQEPSKDKVSIYEGKKVILADSHAMEKESLHTELERLGFEITCCDDSSEARKIVLENPCNTFALVFIDARSVPHESNDLHDISNASPMTKCLLMSHFGVPMAEDFQQQGYSAILMRPIQRSRLADIIKRLLDDETSSDAKKALKSAPNEKGMLQSLAERHPLKILLAEDNIINTRVALQHLKRMGYNAEHAKDGVEVLRMCQREIDAGRPMYDCVLMDIQMPNKDGIAASQELKELYKDDCPNVIALTANAGGEDRRKCLDAGMVSYLAKPILPADLAAVLMSVQVAERDTKKVEK
ncbi:Histidine protein kinase 1 [Yarrowia sp. B02]|nr:Histidine protein kinase 1 [Yarrowia sp. B02]